MARQRGYEGGRDDVVTLVLAKALEHVHVGLCVHVSHRVGVGLLQPLVPRGEGLESVLDLCSGLCGAAQTGRDLQP